MQITACGEEEGVAQVSYDERMAPTDSESSQHEGSAIEWEFMYTFAMTKGTQTELENKAQHAFISYLSRATGHTFKLVNMIDNADIAEQLGNDEVHFALLDTSSLLPGMSQYGVQPIVKAIDAEHKGDIQAFFVALAGSPLKEMSDIKGKVLALGAKNSLRSGLIPLVSLASNGILLSGLEQLKYAGSEKNCINALLDNTADVCGVSAAFASTYLQNNQVKLLGMSDYYPAYSIASNLYVEESVKQSVVDALLQLGRVSHLFSLSGSVVPSDFAVIAPLDYEALNEAFIQSEIRHLEN